ncbi:MAG: hypothetical protein EXR08_09945 [Alphaproteobacteria bacterium]|nr:hypothetical protein [Alphaproteobacteria bacterium]
MEYENYRLCPDLKIKEFCIVLEQYHDGSFDREFHQHIPSHRLSQPSKIEMLKALVVRYAQFGPETIVSAYVNERGHSPLHSDQFRFHNSYPEPGVQRVYCGTNTKAWIDQVIAPTSCRVNTQ